MKKILFLIFFLIFAGLFSAADFTFKIERGIPFPKEKPKLILPLIDMLKGDSFLVPSETWSILHGIITKDIGHFEMENKSIKFELRPVKGGIRIWRKE